MYCPKCGKENPDDANVCAQCGATLKEPTEAKKTNINLKAIIPLACAFVVAVVLLVVFISNSGKVNLNKYLVFEETGANGYGRVSITFDTEKFVADNGKKFKLNSEVKKELSKWGFNAKEIADYLEDYTSDYLAESFIYDVDIIYEYNSNLSNGDKVEYEIVVDEDAIKYLDVKLVCKPGTYKVSGLKDVEKKEAFENVAITMDGRSPYNVVVTVKNNNSDPDLSELSFRVGGDYNYVSNGDKFTITITDESIERNIKKNGVAPATTVKEYTISGMPERVSKVEQIDKEALDYMIAEANDYMTAYVAKNWGNDEELVELKHTGTWVATPKKGGSANNVFLSFDLTVHFSDAGYGLDKTETITWYIIFSDLYTKDGKIDMSNVNYRTARDYGDRVYWCKENGEKNGSCWDKYYYYGYENVDTFVKARINSMVDNFVIDGGAY